LVPGFTWDNYRAVVTTPLYRTYAVNTFLIAAPTALFSVIGGFVLAYFLAFRARRSLRFLLIAIVIAFLGVYLSVVHSWRTLGGGFHHAGLPRWYRLQRDVWHADRRPARHDPELSPRRGDGVRDVRPVRRRGRRAPHGHAHGRSAPEAYAMIGRSRLLTAAVI